MRAQVLECKVMVSSTGHDGPMGASGVKRLSKLGMITGAPGMGALDMNSAEDAVVCCPCPSDVAPSGAARSMCCDARAPRFRQMLLRRLEHIRDGSRRYPREGL